MSRATTPTPSSSAATQESKYTIRVIKAELNEVLKKKTLVWVEIKPPGVVPVLTQTAEAPKLEWNRKIDFTSLRTSRIRMKLSKRESTLPHICLGEGSVTIGDLHDHCQGGQGTLGFFPKHTCADCGVDYSLVLINPRNRKSIGTLLLQLRKKAETGRYTHDVTGSRKLVETMRTKISDTLGVNFPISAHSPSSSVNAVSTISQNSERDGFETLSRVRNQLESMNSGKHRMALSVIDAASKIHPTVESSWKIISSLHRVYEKKPRMDSGVIKVFVSIDYILSFVEDVDRLKNKTSRFFNLIEESLHIIESCGKFILEYLHSSTKDQLRLALSHGKELDYYENELRKRVGDLGLIVNVHVAHRIDENHKEVMEALERNGRPVNSQPILSGSSQSIIPAPPTVTFTGRNDYLRKMETSFQLPKSSVEIKKQRKYVLYGTGGMGKTQVALKFLEENSESFTLRYIIDASSHETIASSFANIGHDAGIPDPNTHKVVDWLRKKIEDWILIFDNADNHDRDVKLLQYFPKCHHGNILITTRNADYETLADSLEVSVLDVSSSVSLLLRTARLEETEENSKMAEKIVGEFGNLALAIVQAGSYVHAQRLTLHEYYERYERSRSSLLKSGPLKEELAYDRPVYATWEISYAALTNPAKTMLDLCAFLYREGISEELWLRAAGSKKAKLVTESETDEPAAPKTLLSLFQHLKGDNIDENVERFRELIRELRSYSLIQEPFKGSFGIHPLVHSWASERMESSHRLESQTNAMHLIYYSLGYASIYDAYLDTSFTRTVIPHMQSCGEPLQGHIALEFAGVYATCGKESDSQIQRLLTVASAWSQKQRYKVNNQNRYTSLIYLGGIYRGLERYCEAIEILQTLVEEQRRVLGNDHRSTLDGLFELAVAHECQGNLADAQELFIEVIEARKRVLGNDHSDTLLSMHELASTYRKQGQLDSARELFTEVVEARKRVLGNDHSSTLISMDCLALTYRDQAQLNDAQELFTEVVKVRKRVHGHDDSLTLFSIHELALAHRDQGQLDDAQELLTQVVEASKRVLGNDHSDTLSSMHELASIYRKQGQLDSAQELFTEVVEASKRVLGMDHSSTLFTMHKLALTYRDQGRLDDAQELLTQVVEASKRVLGIDHSDTLLGMHELALTYQHQGRLDDTRALFAEVVETSKRVLGNDHHSTLASMCWLALTYQHQGELDNAQELLTQVVEACKRVLGIDHSDTLLSMHELALTLRKQGQLDGARELFTEVIEASERVLGKDHSSTLVSMHQLALTYRDQGRLDDTQALFAKVVEASKRVLGNDHSSTLSSMCWLASTYLHQGPLDDARKLLTQIIEASKRIPRKGHSSTLTSMNGLASTYRHQGRLDDAQELLTAVVEASKRILGNDHSNTLISMHNLASTYRSQGLFDDARELFTDVVNGRKRVLGNDHASTLASMHSLALTYQRQGQLGTARELFVEVVNASKRVLGNDHSDTLISIQELALTYRRQGRLGDAQQLLTEVVEASKRVLGNDHSDTLISMQELASTYRRQGRLGDAQQLLTEVVEASKRVLGKDHSDTLFSMHELALTYQHQGESDAAAELGLEAYELCKQAFGPSDSWTISSRKALIDIYTQQGRLGDAGRLKTLNSNRTSMFHRTNCFN